MVIIDKEEAFFGGLDLCYGRYDCNKHEIFPTDSTDLYPGIEYNNCRLKDINNVRKFTIDHIDKRNPRLPWHDICQSVRGGIVSDFVHHFVEIWNFASY
jgi:phospholipase D1/2